MLAWTTEQQTPWSWFWSEPIHHSTTSSKFILNDSPEWIWRKGCLSLSVRICIRKGDCLVVYSLWKTRSPSTAPDPCPSSVVRDLNFNYAGGIHFERYFRLINIKVLAPICPPRVQWFRTDLQPLPWLFHRGLHWKGKGALYSCLTVGRWGRSRVFHLYYPMAGCLAFNCTCQQLSSVFSGKTRSKFVSSTWSLRMLHYFCSFISRLSAVPSSSTPTD